MINQNKLEITDKKWFWVMLMNGHNMILGISILQIIIVLNTDFNPFPYDESYNLAVYIPLLLIGFITSCIYVFNKNVRAKFVYHDNPFLFISSFVNLIQYFVLFVSIFILIYNLIAEQL